MAAARGGKARGKSRGASRSRSTSARAKKTRAPKSPSKSTAKTARTAKTPKQAKPSRRSGAEALVDQLRALDVEVVFGLPGVHNLAIFHALDRAGLRTIIVRHEQAAAYAADGYARVTGRLGVCVTTTGPGAANTAGALGEARASRSPVLHISTQVQRAILAGKTGRFSLHESPAQRELMDAVCVWAGSVARADAIPTMLQRAAVEAFAGRRGPVFVEIPFDLLDEPVSWEVGPAIAPPIRRPEEDAVMRAAGLLDDAKRPVIWSGGGAISSGASAEVAALAEALRAPVVTTFAGKGILPADHPLLVGMPPHMPEVTKLLTSADALVVIGSDLDAMNTQGWRIPLPRPRVSINTVAEDARRNYAADVVIESDASRALDALTAALTKKRRGDGAARAARARDAAEATLEADKGLARGWRFAKRLQATVPDGTALFADMAIPGYWAAGFWRPPGPRSFAYPLGWGTLGFAFPAAIGAAATGRRTLVVAGDGGLLFAAGEFATVAQEKLPVTVLVVNDGGYGMLRYDEHARFDRSVASDLTTPDFVALAEAFGVPAKRVTLTGLTAGLKWGLGVDGPALVEVRARLEPPPTTSPRWPLKGAPEARP